ncbi:MAG: tetratricopeptide repeat protein [Candidatus Omnitrophica bacterium]|nr:tetratricopeptide repeat protein [Candidatus Omnitrophota bacterium]
MFLLSVIFFADGRVFAFDRQTAAALTRYIMAGFFEKQGDIDLAVQEYKKALKADEKNPVIHLSLGAAYIKKKEISLAIEEINRAVVLEPDAVEPHAILALLYFAQEKLSEAGKEYERALQSAAKLEPKNISIFKSLGILYLQQKNYKSAEDTFLSIIGISPTDFEAHFYLANTLDEQKKKEAAIIELKKVLELKPEYHQALNYLGYLYVEENKNLVEAEKMIKKALEIDPQNGAYIDSLGWLYFKQGKAKEAVKELEKASAIMDDPVIFEHLGDAYFKVQDFTQAKANWEKSLKLEPNKPEVMKKIDGLKNK